MSNSIIDYVFRALGLEYLNRTDIVQNPPKEEDKDVEQEPSASPVQEKPNATLEQEPSASPVQEKLIEPTTEVEQVETTNNFQSSEPTSETQEVQFLTKVEEIEALETTETVSNSVTTVQEVLGDMMGDAPACNECGHITIRNGSCYKCLNCGNSLGCS